jgi:hypothetical protein
MGLQAADVKGFLDPVGQLATTRGPGLFPERLRRHVLVEHDIGDQAPQPVFSPSS